MGKLLEDIKKMQAESQQEREKDDTSRAVVDQA